VNRHQHIWSLRGTVVVVLVALCGAIGAARSWADDRGRREDGRHGDIHRFHERDLREWHGGHWVHDRHAGRLGWWWVVGGVWYFFPAPVYPYPDPYVPPTVVAPPAPPPAPTQYWYYCARARAYYPYVTSCPEGWMQVVPPPATPRPGG
jgi:hypothetical protein